jgi:DnaK suppressor protein
MDKQTQKNKLEEEKKNLLQSMSPLGKSDKTGDWETTLNDDNEQEVQDEADMAERAEEYQENTQILNNLEERLKDIDDALLKIDSEEYGVCETCEGKIEEDRLEVNPAARTCKTCMNL